MASPKEKEKPKEVERAETDEEKKARDEYRQKRISLLKKISKNLRKRTGFRHKTNEDWDKIIRVKDLHLFTFSMIGLATSIFLSWYKWEERCYLDPGGNCILDVTGEYAKQNPDQRRVTATIGNTQKYLESVYAIMLTAQFSLSFSTLCCLVLLAQYYKLRLTERRREWSGMDDIDLLETTEASEAEEKRRQFRQSYNFFQSSLRWEILVEFFVHVVHPIVWVEILDDPTSKSALFQTTYEITECFIFLRLYLLLRVLYINSNTYVFRNDIIASNKELQRAGYNVSASSTFKIMFYNNPGTMVFSLTFFSVIIFGFWIFVIERNGNPQFERLYDSYWFVWISLSTIGYGDITATSATGRSVVVVIAIASLLITTVFSGIVTNLLSPTREQKYVQGYLQEKWSNVEYKKAAVNLIVIVHKQKKERRAMRNPLPAYGKRTPEVYAAIKRLRSARLALRESLGSAADPVVDIKLQRAIVLAHKMNELLDQQGAQIVVLEEKILKATATIKHRGSIKKAEVSWHGKKKQTSTAAPSMKPAVPSPEDI